MSKIVQYLKESPWSADVYDVNIWGDDLEDEDKAEELDSKISR